MSGYGLQDWPNNLDDQPNVRAMVGGRKWTASDVDGVLWTDAGWISTDATRDADGRWALRVTDALLRETAAPYDSASDLLRAILAELETLPAPGGQIATLLDEMLNVPGGGSVAGSVFNCDKYDSLSFWFIVGAGDQVTPSYILYSGLLGTGIATSAATSSAIPASARRQWDYYSTTAPTTSIQSASRTRNVVRSMQWSFASPTNATTVRMVCLGRRTWARD